MILLEGEKRKGPAMGVERMVDAVLIGIARIAELGAGLVLLVGAGRALWEWWRQLHRHPAFRSVRGHLGWSVILALEFLIAADVLSTAVAPNWNQIGQLGVIILLRLLLTVSLEKELRHTLTREEPATESDASAG